MSFVPPLPLCRKESGSIIAITTGRLALLVHYIPLRIYGV